VGSIVTFDCGICELNIVAIQDTNLVIFNRAKFYTNKCVMTETMNHCTEVKLLLLLKSVRIDLLTTKSTSKFLSNCPNKGKHDLVILVPAIEAGLIGQD
jgi:hypothetical protein